MSNIEQLFAACQELLDIDYFRYNMLKMQRDYCLTSAILAIRNCLPGAVSDLRQAQARIAASGGLKGWGE